MICLPIFDLPTRSSSGYLIRYVLPRMGPRFVIGPMAQNPFFSIVANGSDLIIGTGHGSPTAYSGFHDKKIWSVGNYDPDQVKGKVVKLVSCDCGAQLLPDLVDKGAICASGYDADLLWIADPIDYFTPWRDEDAALVMKPIADGLNALLDGATCLEAFNVEQAALRANAEKTDFDLQRALIEFDLNHGVIFGNGSAAISPRPQVSMPIPPPPLLL